jgi:hypothetical protein
MEKRETSPCWLNPGLSIWVNPGPRPKPPAREPKELILCAEQGIPQTTMRIAMTTQTRGGICTSFSSSSVTQTGRTIATKMSDPCQICSYSRTSIRGIR